MLINFIKKMKIFQVKYNTEYYCYYKAEEKQLFNVNTSIYKDYNDCREDKNKINGFELQKVSKALLKYFKLKT